MCLSWVFLEHALLVVGTLDWNCVQSLFGNQLFLHVNLHVPLSNACSRAIITPQNLFGAHSKDDKSTSVTILVLTGDIVSALEELHHFPLLYQLAGKGEEYG